MAEKLREAHGAGEGPKPKNSIQALDLLLGELAGADFPALAIKSGAEYLEGPPEALRIDFLGDPHLVRRDEVVAETGEPPSIWVKVFLMYYALHSTGATPSGQWKAFRDLPNTVSKYKSFEHSAERLAEAFAGRRSDLAAAARQLGGEAVDGESADLAYIFQTLPRVRLMLLFWDGDEDFAARASILVDAGILDYLDRETTCFLAEAFANRLMGKSTADIVH